MERRLPMLPLPAGPAAPLPRRPSMSADRRRARLRLMLAGSVLLHALLLAAFLLRPVASVELTPSSPGIAMMFESPAPAGPRSPQPDANAGTGELRPQAPRPTAPEAAAEPAPRASAVPPVPAPVAEPAPQPPDAASPPPAPAVPPQPATPPPAAAPAPAPAAAPAPVAPPVPAAPPAPAMPPVPAAPAPEATLAPAPPTPVQPTPAPPAVATPAPAAPSPPAAPATVDLTPAPLEQMLDLPPLTAPEPPLPLPPLPPSRPAPQRPPRSAARPQGFPAPQAWSFGGAGRMPGAAASRGLDLAFTPTLRGGGGEPDLQIHAPGAGAAWEAAFDAWWQRHGHYPQEAAREGNSGQVHLHMFVDPDGHVRAAQVVGRSGSIWLDQGALATFAGATLPALSGPKANEPLDFSLVISYRILP